MSETPVDLLLQGAEKKCINIFHGLGDEEIIRRKYTTCIIVLSMEVAYCLHYT